MPKLPTPDLVAAIRDRAGTSQEELARRLGVSFASVNAWERGRSSPRRTHRAALDRMAAELGIAQGTTALLVDDDPLSLTIAEALFEAEAPEVEVHTSTDGHEGLLLCGTLRPDLLLLDVMMPGIDGLEVARRVQAVAELRHVVTYLISASTSAQLRDVATTTPARAVLTKPLRSADVHLMLDEVRRSTGQASAVRPDLRDPYDTDDGAEDRSVHPASVALASTLKETP